MERERERASSTDLIFHSILNSISIHDIRFVYSDAENALRFGAHTSKIALKPRIKAIFNRTVFDPAAYLANGYSQNNHCIPGSILICLYKRLGQKLLRNSTQARFAEELRTINTTNLYKMGKQGLALSDMPKIEALNSPIPDSLRSIFPQLGYFSGLSLNMYQIKVTDGVYGIFPVSLSQHCRSSDRFQVDLLMVTPSLLPDNASVPSNHVFAIPFMPTLVVRCSNKVSNKSKYTNLCRSCVSLHRNTQALTEHYLTCAKDSRRGSAQPRKRSRNIYIHRPTVFNKFFNREEVNGLFWKRSDNSKLIKPLIHIYADIECFCTTPQQNNDMFERVPSKAVQQQTIMSYAYCIKCLYPKIALPEVLTAPRMRFCSQTTDSSDKDLFLSFFLNLRNDLVTHAKWIRELLSHDRPPPPPSQRSPQMRAYFLSITHCQVTKCVTL